MDCNDEIKTLIAERMEKGRKAYDWLQEALEEALDLSIYLSAKLIELRKLDHCLQQLYSHATV